MRELTIEELNIVSGGQESPDNLSMPTFTDPDNCDGSPGTPGFQNPFLIPTVTITPLNGG